MNINRKFAHRERSRIGWHVYVCKQFTDFNPFSSPSYCYWQILLLSALYSWGNTHQTELVELVELFELVELAFKFRQPGSRLCTCNDCISLIITEMQVSTAVILLVTCNIGINENTSTSSLEKWALTLCGKILWYHLFGGQFDSI